MKISKSYKLSEFLDWTRRKLYVVLALAIVPVALYQLLDQKWIALPWSLAVLLGTATSFIVGFKNAQTYNRTVEAQQVWTAIASASRYWGTISCDFPTNPRSTKTLIHRHLAWLTVLRYQLRDRRVWESVAGGSDAEYRKKFYSVPEAESPLEVELAKYLSKDELEQLAATKNKASWLIRAQSGTIKDLFASQQLAVLHHTEMQKTLKDLLDQQSKAERIKNFPYPRQYATINTIFVWCFAALLPLCVIREFDRLNEGVSGVLAGQMAWLAVPFSALVSWMYLSLDQVGESTENPFEGGANDVPISQISRLVEIELREMLGETGLPPLLRPQHDIVL
jgi:ion channel-forming bestrophin family protein